MQISFRVNPAQRGVSSNYLSLQEVKQVTPTDRPTGPLIGYTISETGPYCCRIPPGWMPQNTCSAPKFIADQMYVYGFAESAGNQLEPGLTAPREVCRRSNVGDMGLEVGHCCHVYRSNARMVTAHFSKERLRINEGFILRPKTTMFGCWGSGYCSGVKKCRSLGLCQCRRPGACINGQRRPKKDQRVNFDLSTLSPSLVPPI